MLATEQEALTGSDLSKGAGLFDGGEVEVLFTDNAILNLTGADFVVFESGTPEPFEVAVGLGGTTFSGYIEYDPVYLDFSEGIAMNGAAIDLDDFVIGAGAWVTAIHIREGSDRGPVIRGAAALNNGVVPEPFSLAFMASAFVGMVGWRLSRRRRRVSR